MRINVNIYKNLNLSFLFLLAASSIQRTVLREDVARLQEVLPNTFRNDIINALSNNATASDTVTLLIRGK